MEGKNLTKFDMYLLCFMGVCTVAYLYTCLFAQPSEAIERLIYYFGIGLGLAGVGKAKA